MDLFVDVLGFGGKTVADLWSLCLQRTRAFIIHGEPVGNQLSARAIMGCNTYSAGEDTNVECIMPKAKLCFLEFFMRVFLHPGYEEWPEGEGPNDKDFEEFRKQVSVVKWEEGRDSEAVEKMRQELIKVSKIE